MFEGFRLLEQAADNFFSNRRTFSMKNAAAAMSIFQTESEFGEVLPPVHKFFNALRPFFQQEFGGGDIAQSVSGVESVLEMKADFILVAEPYSLTFRVSIF